MRGACRETRCSRVLQLPAQRQLSRQPPPRRGPARLQWIEGGDGTDRQGRCGPGAGHAAEPVLDAARLRRRLLAEVRQADPSRSQPRPYRPHQAGDGRHLRRRQAGRPEHPGQALADRRRRGSRGAKGAHPSHQVGLAAGAVGHGPRGR